MEPSVVGILICCALLLVGCCYGSPIIIGLLASLPFGATAIITISGLGGSSPLIYTAFVLMLLLVTALRPNAFQDISAVFKDHWLPWLVLVLMVYIAAGAYILPRLFFGQTTAFVPINGEIVEKPLAPVPGNITQPGYFALGVLTFYALCANLRDKSAIDIIGRGFFAFASLQVVLGVIDLGGKMIGITDALALIRSASYSMLAEVQVYGFWRISGGFSEASAFAATSVSCLAFVFTYWRATGATLALILTLALIGLLVLSTSSTAYVALTLLSLSFLCSLMYSVLANRIRRRDIVVTAIALATLTVIGALQSGNEKLLDSFFDLLNSMIFEKHASMSGVERAYWNFKSLQSLIDTEGLGIGMGSSRSSSWLVSMLSQLGLFGALMIGALVLFLTRDTQDLERVVDRNTLCIARSARACSVASLVTLSISGGGADPGLIFFVALAVLVSCHQRFRRSHPRYGTPLTDVSDRRRQPEGALGQSAS